MKIRLYRIILNILFYIFYVIIVSIAFSFIFPTILVVLWQDVIAPNNPIFDTIQIIIIVIVLLISLLFRKYFYLPIREEVKNDNKEKIKFKEYKKKEEKIEDIDDKKIWTNDELELDIKIGKEIK